jgi:hypothetical protein
MRKLILIAGFVLASATAQAGEPRSLSLAGSDVTAAAAPAAPADATKTAQAPAVADTPQASEAPKYIERPTLVEPKSETAKTEPAKVAEPTAEPAKPVAAKTAKAEKPRKKRYWNEARIINELHRHGVYW